ncbi:hypothetical protein [Tumidithrix helvetica]
MGIRLPILAIANDRSFSRQVRLLVSKFAIYEHLYSKGCAFI